MDFGTTPKNLNKTNQDYDIEVWWYGWKNLLMNYYSNLKLNNMDIKDYVNGISDKLNELQNNKQYLEIYTKIYECIILFIETINNTNTLVNHYNFNLIITWLKRYNNIDYIKKINLINSYTGKTITELSQDMKTIIKFYVKYYLFEYGDMLSVQNNFSNILDNTDNFNYFFNHCIENKYDKIIGIFSMSYNLQNYFDYKKINRKYTPMKALKLYNLKN